MRWNDRTLAMLWIAAMLGCGVTPASAQYTIDTAIQGSVLGETRKIDGKARPSQRMTAEQRAFWKKYCARWPEGGSCDRYRREVARYPDRRR
ncbi:hypothetical protein OK349_03440 [Sphingomonas sp. BT-65]|uniref:hypothetical protein n=1 Tax=Sphingomonas sp. BT-65 TaxID=2989821 RepID=UPI002236A84A|nr:hypothetical protein [Sphingomonas sp. BT-65]MCW4460747.1 hypothetical protein [Sphingomonas sp. BT-65]